MNDSHGSAPVGVSAVRRCGTVCCRFDVRLASIFFARSLTLSVYLMSTSISWLFVQGLRFNSMSSAVTGQKAHVTLASCDTEHPFQQRSENNIKSSKTRKNKIFPTLGRLYTGF